MVTNQSGIGRGLYDWTVFNSVQTGIDRLLEQSGARIDALAACPFHAEGTGPFAVADHPCRKPAPGMVHLLAGLWTTDLARSWIVGDNETDLSLAERAGLAGAVHVRTGHGQRDRAAAQAALAAGQRVVLVDSLAGAVDGLLKAMRVARS
jgi:D-glycero-D-manno-heptose 1,7-bisphosphate phosphatase